MPEDWWQGLTALGSDALILLLGIATWGGTNRDKPPTLGAGKTSDLTREGARGKQYAQTIGAKFDPDEAYQRLRNVSIRFRTATDTVLTKAKAAPHMQLTKIVGNGLLHHIRSDASLQEFLRKKIAPNLAKPDPFFGPHDGAAIQMSSVITTDADVLRVTAAFGCRRCGEKVRHEYSMNQTFDVMLFVEVVCMKCKLTMRHRKGEPRIRPDVVD